MQDLKSLAFFISLHFYFDENNPNEDDIYKELNHK
jgi:hypothetical protein